MLVRFELLITCDYHFLTFGLTDDSIISKLGGLNLAKQDRGMESPTKTDIKLSLDSNEDKCGPSDPSDKVQEAPVELKGEVHTACQ